MKTSALILACFMPFIYACQDQKVPDPEVNKMSTSTDFQSNIEDWSADFTDYGVAQENSMEFKSDRQNLPDPLDKNRKALMVSGQNRSASMFMFIKKKISGLQPNTEYKLLFEVELASKYPVNSVGIGASPSLGVILKAGASSTEPVKVKNGDYYNLNLDKGDIISEGKDLITLGHVGIDNESDQYALIQRNNKEKIFTAKTNDSGELWLIVGTDSGFEGLTTLYYTNVKVTPLAYISL
ncbi:hypothetical protein IC229_33065 [Spirosoma sp. BT702]|uniref:Lipoprotein n=1 Tax=Spirosoma profusum TaxID=2771354 RepID=A0A927GAS6_9BACT|nr:hypothetical protein [Spirosoma profusum]MBD2705489.1 hypothetical protein [Spirosoma profusum]